MGRSRGVDLPRAALIVSALALAAAGLALVLGGFGMYAYAVRNRAPDIPATATFVRPMQPNCGEVFYCVNATDVNPSYVAFLTAGPSAAPWLPVFSVSAGVFDVSDPYATVVRVAGTYQFAVFMPMISFDAPFNASVILTRETGPLLSTPALSGAIAVAPMHSVTGLPTMASVLSAIAVLNAGDAVRVGYIVDGNAMATPGSYLAGFLIAAA